MSKRTTPSAQLQFEFPKAERKSVSERFWEKVDVPNDPDSCWIWTGFRNKDGYGSMRATGTQRRMIGAHRLSWELHNGPIPPGIKVLHKCDNPPCVRPDHLFLGTQLDNIADRVAKGRSGHTMGRPGELHYGTKITDLDVIKIRERCAKGEKQRSVAAEYGVGEGCISRIVLRKTWRHIP